MDDLELLRSFSPGAVVEPDTKARERVRAAIAERLQESPRHSVRRRNVREPRWLRPAGALVACALAAVIVIVNLGSGTAQSSAAQLLDRAADVLAAKGPGPGRYYYERFRAVTPVFGPTTPSGGLRYAVIVRLEGASWIRADGFGVLRAHARLEFPSSRDRAIWKAQGSPSLGSLALGTVARRLRPDETTNTTLAYFGLSLAELTALANRPSGLDARLRYAATHPVGHRLDVPGAPPPGLSTSEGGLVASLLGSEGTPATSPLPPALRAALYRVLAHQPNVHVVARFVDRLGRRGIGVTYGPVTMIFDARSYELRETRTNIPRYPWYTVTLASGVVASEAATL